MTIIKKLMDKKKHLLRAHKRAVNSKDLSYAAVLKEELETVGIQLKKERETK